MLTGFGRPDGTRMAPPNAAAHIILGAHADGVYASNSM